MNVIVKIKSVVDRKRAIKALADKAGISLGEASRRIQIGGLLELEEVYPDAPFGIIQQACPATADIQEHLHSVISVDGLELDVLITFFPDEIEDIKEQRKREAEAEKMEREFQEAQKWLQEQPEDVKRYVGILTRQSHAVGGALMELSHGETTFTRCLR